MKKLRLMLELLHFTANDFGNCASLRYLGVFPVKHYYSSCLNRIGIFCTSKYLNKNVWRNIVSDTKGYRLYHGEVNTVCYRFVIDGQTSGSAQLSWTEAVKQCGTMKTDLNGYYTGLTDSVKYYPLWTGFYRRSIEQWTPPSTYALTDNVRSYHLPW